MIVAPSAFHTEEIGVLHHGGGAHAVTPDGHIVGFANTERGIAFVRNGQAGGYFDDIPQMRDKAFATFVSGNGAHIAWVGIRGGVPFIGRDLTEDPPVTDPSFSAPPTWDHAGTHLAYGARITPTGESQLVVDGVPRDGRLAPIRPAWSPDGQRLAYAEIRGTSQQDTEFRIVVDETPGEWFRGLRNAPGTLQFSPDSRRFAYYTVLPNGRVRWTVDGVAQREFHDTRPLGLPQLRGIGVLDTPLRACFSPDGRRFAYWADVVEKGVAIVEDDALVGPILHAAGAPVFSPDSSRLAYVGGTKDGKALLIVDGVRMGEWVAEQAPLPVFSPDNRHVAATIQSKEGGPFRKRNLVSVSIDGSLFERLEADDIQAVPAMTSDAARLAWWIQRGDEFLLVDHGSPRTDAPPPHSDVVFSASGRLAYGTELGNRQTIVVDGRPGPLAEAIVPLNTASQTFGHGEQLDGPRLFRLSHDGDHVAWAGLFEGLQHPVLDDSVGPELEAVIGCQFDGSTSTWWGYRDGALFRITYPIGTPSRSA